MENRLFVTYKPKGLVSNRFLSKIKRKYNVKKAGFSGTLDPFASGVLIVAFNQYTKLFRFLKKTPKTYKATLWIGASSDTLDTDGINKVENLMAFDKSALNIIFKSLLGEVEFIPPKYSAKKIDGKRAYKLARADVDFELKKEVMRVYDLKVLHYFHPFLTFEVSVSEGGYVRSLGEIIARRLGFDGSLSALHRVSEGEFIYENEKSLNPLKFLDMEENWYLDDVDCLRLGKKLDAEKFKIKKNGTYFVLFDEEFAIITIKDKCVKYELNKVRLC